MLIGRTDVHLGGMSPLPLKTTSILLSPSSLSPVPASSGLAMGDVSLLAGPRNTRAWMAPHAGLMASWLECV